MHALIFLLFATAHAANFTPLNTPPAIECVDDMGCNGAQRCLHQYCLPNPANCVTKGAGGNETGLGGMGGCSYDEECCEGLRCTRTSNDFYTCE